MRGKNALVQVVVKNIARKEAKEPETRSDDEVRAELRAKGEQVVKVRTMSRRERPPRRFFRFSTVMQYVAPRLSHPASSVVVLLRETAVVIASNCCRSR